MGIYDISCRTVEVHGYIGGRRYRLFSVIHVIIRYSNSFGGLTDLLPGGCAATTDIFPIYQLRQYMISSNPTDTWTRYAVRRAACLVVYVLPFTWGDKFCNLVRGKNRNGWGERHNKMQVGGPAGGVCVTLIKQSTYSVIRHYPM